MNNDFDRVDEICRERAELQCAVDAATEACILADAGVIPRCEATMQTSLARMYLQKYIDGLELIMMHVSTIEKKNVEKWQDSLFPEKKS